MDILETIVGIILILLFLLSKILKGTECPVCHSTDCWEEYYWGINTDTKTNYCSNCNRVLHNYSLGKFTTFEEPQNF